MKDLILKYPIFIVMQLRRLAIWIFTQTRIHECGFKWYHMLHNIAMSNMYAKSVLGINVTQKNVFGGRSVRVVVCTHRNDEIKISP